MIAITIRVFDQIFLMLLMRFKELVCLPHFGFNLWSCILGDLSGVHEFLNFFNNFLRNLFLLIIMIENYGSILRASISTLLVKRGWIMEYEEMTAKLLKSHFSCLVFHVKHLNKTCPLGANLSVCGILGCVGIRAHEPDPVIEQPRFFGNKLLHIPILSTPITTSSECCHFLRLLGLCLNQFFLLLNLLFIILFRARPVSINCNASYDNCCSP